MRSLALVLATTGLVRNERQVQADAVDAAAAVEQVDPSEAEALEELPEVTEDAALLEQAEGSEYVQLAPHCGSGVTAEYDCVKRCLKDAKCSRQPEVRAVLADVPELKVEQEGDGWVYGEGSLCVRPQRGKSWCKRGAHDAVACHRGQCTAYDDDRPCTEDSNDQKCRIWQLQKATPTELQDECFDDRICRQRLLMVAGEKFMSALKLTCLMSSESGWGGKRCFYSPTHSCVGKCRDGLSCQEGRCPEEIGNRLSWYMPTDDADMKELSMRERAGNFGNTLIGRGGKNGAYCQSHGGQPGKCRSSDTCPGHMRIGGAQDGCAWGYTCCGTEAKKCFSNDQPGTCQKKESCPDHYQTGGKTDGCAWGHICCGDEPKRCMSGRGRCAPKHECRTTIRGRWGYFDGCGWGLTCCGDD